MKKKLLIALGALVSVAAIVACSVFGTIAYLTSASKVSNVFTVGNVFITLDESAVNAEGQIDPSAGRTDRNSYHLIPGKSYDKDPRITVQADTESCYLFLVTRNQITEIEEKDDPTKLTMAQQMVANGWGIYKDTTAGSRVWVYCGETANVNQETMYAITPVAVCGSSRTAGEGVISATTIDVFFKFHITNDTEVSETISLYSGAEVTLNAVGIQSDTFGEIGEMSSIDAAWAAVVNQYPYIQDDISNN